MTNFPRATAAARRSSSGPRTAARSRCISCGTASSIGSDRFQAVRNTATELVSRPEFARGKFAAELAESSVETWALKESFPLAIKYVYRDGTLRAGSSKGSGEPLPAGYLEQAKPVAERQLVLAGYRLAVTLRGLMR